MAFWAMTDALHPRSRLPSDPCPCGSGAPYGDCCAPIVEGRLDAPTAEALMRSRYTAFSLGDMDHVARTWAPETRSEFDGGGEVEAGEVSTRTVDWTRLEILGTTGGGVGDDTGTVTFAATGRHDGRSFVHRETSRFRREGGTEEGRAGRWVYVDGEVAPVEPVAQAPVRVDKVGRNQPCPCGSGKKFKKCCGA